MFQSKSKIQQQMIIKLKINIFYTYFTINYIIKFRFEIQFLKNNLKFGMVKFVVLFQDSKIQFVLVKFVSV